MVTGTNAALRSKLDASRKSCWTSAFVIRCSISVPRKQGVN